MTLQSLLNYVWSDMVVLVLRRTLELHWQLGFAALFRPADRATCSAAAVQ